MGPGRSGIPQPDITSMRPNTISIIVVCFMGPPLTIRLAILVQLGTRFGQTLDHNCLFVIRQFGTSLHHCLDCPSPFRPAFRPHGLTDPGKVMAGCTFLFDGIHAFCAEPGSVRLFKDRFIGLTAAACKNTRHYKNQKDKNHSVHCCSPVTLKMGQINIGVVSTYGVKKYPIPRSLASQR